MKQAKLTFGKHSVQIQMDVDSDTFKNACLELVTRNGRPFSVLSDSGFQMLAAPIMQALKCHVDEKSIRDILSERAARMRSSLGSALQSTLLCIKMDAATRMDRSFLGINIQYVRSGELCLKTLGVSEIIGPHTAENLRLLLQQTLAKFSLRLDDVLSITTDNGANMISCTKIINEGRDRKTDEDQSESEDEENEDLSDVTFESLEKDASSHVASTRCAAHTLQLVVRDVIKAHSKVSEAVTAARNVVKKLRRPTLRSLVKQRFGKRPIIDVETRWMSTFDMLACLLSMRSLTDELGPAMPELFLGCEMWQVVEETVTAMRPFKEMTLKLQTENLLAGDFFAAWEKLKISLGKQGSMNQECLSASLLRRMQAREPMVLNNDVFLAAVFCDPRYRLLLNSYDTQRAQTYLRGVAAIIIKKQRLEGGDPVEQECACDDISCAEDSEDELERALAASERDEKTSVQQGASDPEFTSSVQWYQKTKRLPKDQDILKWWHSQDETPIKKAALTVLALPVTQVSVERLFSGLAFILSPLRGRLDGTTIENIMFLRTNGVQEGAA